MSLIENAACEPEIVDLAGFLTACGAKIAGAGKGRVIVEGSLPLTGATYTILPDRIETATFLCACAACGGALTLSCRPCSERAHRKRLPDFLLT